MATPPSAADLDKLSTVLRDYALPTITGAALGTLIRATVPNLDIRAAVGMSTGAGALSRFVDLYLSHVLRKSGRTAPETSGGGDIRYEKVNQPAAGSTTPEAARIELTDYWNAFVRPSDTRHLVVVRGPDGLSLELRDAPPTAPDLPVEAVRPDEFKTISDAFIAQLSSSESTRQLASALSAAATYSSFVEQLRNAGYAFFNQWSVHRREKLRQLFVTRLAGHQIPIGEQQSLLEMLDRSQATARQETRQRALERSVATQPVETSSLTDHAQSEASARTAIKAAIDRMSMAEVRALQIPFGHAFDAFCATYLKK